MDTLGQENVRKLSVVLIVDLLKLERDTARAAEIANDMTALAEDLLMSGDYADARDVAAALSDGAANPEFVARAACREALASLSHSAALHETVAILGELDPDPLAAFTDICSLLGSAVVDTLMMTLKMPDRSPALERGSDDHRRVRRAGDPAADVARGRRADVRAVQPGARARADRARRKRCRCSSRCSAATIRS